MNESGSVCHVCTNNANELVDSSKWHRMLFIVPMSKQEIEEARKLALKEFDAITQEYQRYGMKISYDAMMQERSDFVKSLDTGEGYYACAADQDHKAKVYWWSYGYGFHNPVVVAVSKKVVNSDELVVHTNDASHCNCDLVPYKAVGCEDIYKFYMSDVAAVKNLSGFIQVYEKEKNSDYGNNVCGLRAGHRIDTDKLLNKVKEFFELNPSGMITFKGISDPAECIC